MITILDCALLSAHVYGATEKKSIQSVATPLSYNEKPDKDGWYYMIDVDPTMHSANHFFAQLYLKFYDNKATDAVVAVRGSLFEDVTNDGIDLLSWYSDALDKGKNDQVPLIFTNLLVKFVAKAHHYIHSYFPHIVPLKLTGHSLGGALAQLMPLRAGFPGQAVVFNSPGVGHVPGVKPELQGWVYNINSRYGLINKIGLALGHIYLVDVPEMEAQAKLLFEEMDQVDLQKSNHFYQLADMFSLGDLTPGMVINEGGLFYRLKSYAETVGDVVKQPLIKNDVQASCQTTDTIPWYQLKSRLTAYLCTAGYTDLINVIKAQHAIDNVVHALQMPANVNLAYSYV